MKIMLFIFSMFLLAPTTNVDTDPPTSRSEITAKRTQALNALRLAKRADPNYDCHLWANSEALSEAYMNSDPFSAEWQSVYFNAYFFYYNNCSEDLVILDDVEINP